MIRGVFVSRSVRFGLGCSGSSRCELNRGWFGSVGFGYVRLGLVCVDLVRFILVRCVFVRCSLVWFGSIWFGPIWFGVFGSVWVVGLVRSSVVQSGPPVTSFCGSADRVTIVQKHRVRGVLET